MFPKKSFFQNVTQFWKGYVINKIIYDTNEYIVWKYSDWLILNNVNIYCNN